jgi:hypothetical protein
MSTKTSYKTFVRKFQYLRGNMRQRELAMRCSDIVEERICYVLHCYIMHCIVPCCYVMCCAVTPCAVKSCHVT